MIPPDQYVSSVDADEHPNTVVMAGAIHAALGTVPRYRQVDVEAEVLNGSVTGRLIIGMPFLQSKYLLTIERIACQCRDSNGEGPLAPVDPGGLHYRYCPLYETNQGEDT